MSWNDFFGGGSLYTSRPGETPGMLQRLLHSGTQSVHDGLMPLMYGGSKSLGTGESPMHDDLWKEYLQRMMWQHINRQPTPQMGVRGHMPQYRNMINRPRQPMGVLGPRS